MIDIASLIPSIIGLGVKTGMAIPWLRKPKPIRQTSLATQLSGKIVGASQAGFGASRGLALREGLRAGSQAAGNIAAAEGQQALQIQQLNAAQQAARQQRLASFGTDLAKGLGDMAALAVGPKGEAAAEAPASQQQIPVGGGQVTQTTEPLSFDQPGVSPSAAPQQKAPIEQVGQHGGLYTGEAIAQGAPSATQGPVGRWSYDPVAMALGTQSPKVVPNVEQELALQLHMNDLALDWAERLGINPVRAGAMLKKQLGLQPGQSSQNPYGITLMDATQLDGEGEY